MNGKIGFVPNIEKDADFAHMKTLLGWAAANRCEAFVPENFAAFLDTGLSFQTVQSEDALCQASDFLVVLGGDGSMLRVAKKAAVFGTPILGINLGHLGYLTDVEKNGAIQALTKVLNRAHKIENRMMLTARVFADATGAAQSYTVLNEVCLSRGTFSRLIRMRVFVNDDYIDTYRADGLIVSTPTGSTAYNLSAGGPILKPDTELIAITPICPHTLYSRPAVVSGGDCVRIEMEDGEENTVLVFDGQEHIPLRKNDTVTIQKSAVYTKILKTNGLGFYDILRSKLVGIRK